LRKWIHRPARGNGQIYAILNESAITRMNKDFHGTILSSAGNDNLKQMMISIIERIHRYLNLIQNPTRLEAEKYEHEMIVRTLLE
jgi:DNA-binding GntR family transcriptional regulator